MTGPLVSVIAITYNSAPFVRETLDSILAQTYRDIELIIADDCSRDDTAAICEEWLAAHPGRFVSTKMVRAEKNGGITRNANNGVFHARGEWIKLIAGDDTLMSNCVEAFVGYAQNNPGTSAIFSGVQMMNEASEFTCAFPSRAWFFSEPVERQLEHLVYDNLLPAAAAFFSRAAWADAGGFDPAYPMMEDYPFWITLLSGNYRMGYLDAMTVCYRTHDNMVSYSPGRMNPVFLQSRIDFAKNVRLPLARKMSPRTRKKVRRDIALTWLKRHMPRTYSAAWPVLWWCWTRIGRRAD
jgi:glycosyltransferase involved in cell wall biosynthesis